MKGKIYRDKIDEQEKRMDIGYVLCDSLCRYVLLLSNFSWVLYIQIWFRVCKRLLFGYKYLFTSSLARTIIVTIITTLLSGIYIYVWDISFVVMHFVYKYSVRSLKGVCHLDIVILKGIFSGVYVSLCGLPFV